MARRRLGHHLAAAETRQFAGETDRRPDFRELLNVQEVDQVEQHQQRVGHDADHQRDQRVLQCDVRHAVIVQIRAAAVRGDPPKPPRQADERDLRRDPFVAALRQVGVDAGVYAARRAQYTASLAEYPGFF